MNMQELEKIWDDANKGKPGEEQWPPFRLIYDEGSKSSFLHLANLMQEKIDKLYEINLHWVHEDTSKGKPIGKFLMMGEIELVCLRPAKHWWQMIVWLPGVLGKKEYGPLEEQIIAAEALAHKFFKQGAPRSGDQR